VAVVRLRWQQLEEELQEEVVRPEEEVVRPEEEVVRPEEEVVRQEVEAEEAVEAHQQHHPQAHQHPLLH
jgi:hypothetical protein